MKIRKTLLVVLSTATIATSGISITSCNKQESVHTNQFVKTKAVDETVYLVTPPADNYDRWYVTLQSLQGILAQDKAKIFIKTNDQTRNSWLEPMKEQMGFNTTEITGVEAIKTLLLELGNSFNNQYVLYKQCTSDTDTNLSIDKATTIAAAENVLMVEESLENEIKKLGFTKFADASDYSMGQLFIWYKDVLNNSMLINQKPSNLNLRDYAISSKCFTTYLDYVKTQESQLLCNLILDWTKPNCPVLGWNEDEVKFVEAISQYSKVTTPSDHCANLSFYSAYSPKQKYSQKHKEKIKAEQGKHYVAIVMSDGDNIQWLQSDFTHSEDYYASKHRGTFPLTWTLSPAPYDVNASVLDKIYSTQTDNDNFICGPSGYGYINYDRYATPDEFAKLSANYMEATDMKVVNFIDFYNDKKNPDAFKYPMSQSQIKGGIWAFGDWYIAGKGGVYWRNDKPIITMREGLWELKEGGELRPEEQQFLSPKQVAARINTYSTNPTTINGYTVVSAHVWSYGKMDSVKQFVDLLDDHVVLVTGEQLIDMISENVPHIDVESADKYPVRPR